MILCNAKAIREFRRLKLKAKIGLVHASCGAEALQDTPAYREAVENGDLFTNDWVLDPAIKGEIPQKLIDKGEGPPASIFPLCKRKTKRSSAKHDRFPRSERVQPPVGQTVSFRETCATVNNAGNNDGSGKAAKEGKPIKGWFESTPIPHR